MIYLDPHTTQVSTDINDHLKNDDSYHCPNPCMMNIFELDPSIAVVIKCLIALVTSCNMNVNKHERKSLDYMSIFLY